jgi:hypothetical protein
LLLLYYNHTIKYTLPAITFLRTKSVPNFWSVEELSKHTKSILVITLILLTSLMLLALNPNITSVKAQGQATVNVLKSIGGTTDPAGPGTYTYADGTDVTFTATPDLNDTFLYWTVSTIAGASIRYDNPAIITVNGGTTYDIEPIFEPLAVATIPYFPTTADAIVVVLRAAGGTTIPPPGGYYLTNATTLTLTAVPASGWQFVHWVISGQPTSVAHGGFPFTATPTDNPYTVGHGYGFTYDYQPVFIPVGSTTPTPTSTSTSLVGGLSKESIIIIALAVIVVIILVAFGAYAYSRRSKK